MMGTEHRIKLKARLITHAEHAEHPEHPAEASVVSQTRSLAGSRLLFLCGRMQSTRSDRTATGVIMNSPGAGVYAMIPGN